MTKEEKDKIIDFVNSDDYMLLNSYISKPYEETIVEQDKEIEKLNNIVETLKTEAFNGIMGFQGEGSFSLGSRTAYQFIYNRINELMDLKGSDR